jgi:hypothetical protein
MKLTPKFHPPTPQMGGSIGQNISMILCVSLGHSVTVLCFYFEAFVPTLCPLGFKKIT